MGADRGGTPIRVLYVDDGEESVADAVRGLERENRVVVIGSTDPAAVLEELDEDCDVIVAGYELPGMTALDLLEKVRSRGFGIPFVVLIGTGDEGSLVELLNEGADFVVRKRPDLKAQYLEISMAVYALSTRKRMGADLLKEREIYRRVVDLDVIGIVVLDNSRHVTIWNAGMSKLTGVPGSSVIGREFSLEISPVLGSTLGGMSLEQLQMGEPQISRDCEVRLPGTDEVRYFLVSCFPLRDDAGGVVGSLLTLIDTTEQKLLERSITESERKYRQLVELADEGIWYMDADKRILFANPRMSEIMGCPSKEMMGKTISQLVDEPSKDIAEECLILCREGEKVVVDFEFWNRLGRRRFVECRASPIIGEDGVFVGAIGAMIDLTSRKTIEDALIQALESREELEKIVNASPVVVLMISAGERWPIDFVSENITQFGFTQSDFVGGGLQFSELIHPDDLDEVQRSFREHLEKDELYFRMEFRILDKNGTVHWVDARALVIKDSSGELRNIQGVLLDTTEQVEYREVVERLARIVDSSVDAIVGKSTDGTITSWNKGAEVLYGYSQDEVIGKPVSLIVPEDRLGEFYEKFEQVKQGVIVPPFETVRKRKDSTLVEVSLTISPVRNRHGEIIGASAVARDISERKEGERALQESEEKFSSAFRGSPNVMAIFAVDNLELMDVNDRTLEFTGWKKEDMVGKSVLELPFVDADEVRKYTAQLMETGSVRDVDFGFADSTGNRHDGLMSAEFIEIGGRSCILAVISDITELRSTERLLRSANASLDKLNMIVNVSPAMAFLWKPAKGWPIEYVSENVSQLGYTPAELTRGDVLFSDIIHPDDISKVDEMSRMQRLSGDADLMLEYRVLTRSGRTVWVEERAHVIEDDEGRETQIRGVVIDITARKRAQEALDEANEKLDLLGSITRHDVMNQIGILSGYLSLLEEDEDAGDRSEHLRAARQACRTMTEQLQFAGSYQKAGTKEPQWTRVRLEFLGAASSLDLEGIAVTEELGDLEVLTDPMFEKVFLNLMLNSRRHGEHVENIHASYVKVNGQLVIAYEDDGIGIPEDSKEKVFQKGVGKDSGLGLFLIREILNITEIDISEVGKPGNGARFEIRVPEGGYRFGAGGN